MPANRSGSLVRDLKLTPKQVRGLTKTDLKWSAELEAALTATSRGDLKHGTNAAYLAGRVCNDCRAADGEEPLARALE